MQQKIDRFNAREARHYRISVSVGSSVHRPGCAIDELLSEADERMYDAKRSSGKMRVAGRMDLGDGLAEPAKLSA